jgi:hypothetical protein
MLHFLSSLFAPSSKAQGVAEEAVIEAAIERAVDGTDPRLRGLRNYRKRLRPAVESAVSYVIHAVDGLPVPAEFSRNAFRSDPRLRAFFASADRLQQAIGGCETVTDFLRTTSGSPPAEIFGLLSMAYDEKQVLGMDLQGDSLRRDVKQTVASFSNHRYLGPTGSEAETRWEIKKRAFDYLVERALQRIASRRGKHVELDEQRRLLGRKLAAMQAGNWGLESMLSTSPTETGDTATLEAEIARIEADLSRLGPDPGNLEHSCESIAGTLGHPQDWLSLREITLYLDPMLVKKDAADDSRSSRLDLSEVSASTGERRIVLLGRFPANELPTRPDFFDEAQRLLR